MREPGCLVYKCRMCGGLDKTLHIPDINAVVNIQIGISLPKEWGCFSPQMTGVHSCEDGGIGITDLVGGEPAVTKLLDGRTEMLGSCDEGA